MNERFIYNEVSSEKVHTEKEILNLIEGVVGENYEVLRTLEDEQGLYILETKTTDEAGNAVHYIYIRAGTYPEAVSSETVIDVAFYIGDVAVGGHPIMKCKNDKWFSI